MAKKTKEPNAYPRVDNAQTFSTLRLIPAINQKNYYTNYLKKDSQYLCRKIRERSEASVQETCIFHLGSQNLRVGLSSDLEPKVLPFCVAKPTWPQQQQQQQQQQQPEQYEFTEEESEALAEAEQSFVDRMKFYKTRVTHNAREMCRDFNARQTGERAGEPTREVPAEGVDGPAYSGTAKKYFCVGPRTRVPPGYERFWPLRRGKLNEDPAFYRSPQELEADIHDILYYATYSAQGINLRAPPRENRVKRVKRDEDTETAAETAAAAAAGDAETGESEASAVLVVPDLFDRSALALFVMTLYELGFQYVAIIEEAVAATYGAGISAGCVVDIGAQTTTVACVEDGLCVPDSRVHLDFGSSDMTRVFGKLLHRIAFPGDPNFEQLDALKREYFTVNEADISVQLYRYYTRNLKFDFKVYNEVMLPVLALFYPHLFGAAVTGPQFEHRYALVPQQLDPYTGRVAGPLSDADINVRMQTLAVLNTSYHNQTVAARQPQTEEVDDDEVDDDDDADAATGGGALDDDEEPRTGTPLGAEAGTASAASSASAAAGTAGSSNAGSNAAAAHSEHPLSQIEAFESLDPKLPAFAPLDHAIIESIAQAQKHSGTAKLYYENILVIGGGSKIPAFYTMLSDRLAMWNQARLKEIGDVAVMAIPQGTDAESICWRGGCVYSKLKIVDEMWTSSDEWGVLGSRTLHYKAALYAY